MTALSASAALDGAGFRPPSCPRRRGGLRLLQSWWMQVAQSSGWLKGEPQKVLEVPETQRKGPRRPSLGDGRTTFVQT